MIIVLSSNVLRVFLDSCTSFYLPTCRREGVAETISTVTGSPTPWLEHDGRWFPWPVRWAARPLSAPFLAAVLQRLLTVQAHSQAACVPRAVARIVPTYSKIFNKKKSDTRLCGLVWPVYVVFGACGGIGSELARQLSASGGRVVLAARCPHALSAITALCSPDRLARLPQRTRMSTAPDRRLGMRAS